MYSEISEHYVALGMAGRLGGKINWEERLLFFSYILKFSGTA